MNYFRITGYCPENDFCFIIDSNGIFEKLWQFSSFLIQKGLQVLEVSKEEQMLDVNIDKVGTNAFKNKGIKTVVIPGHINSLGNSAFAENQLTKVTIEDKYDQDDFEYYGENVFGNFKDVKHCCV